MKLPRGYYFIGDPSYVINDHNWMTCYGCIRNDPPMEISEYKGFEFFAHHTAGGDGIFPAYDNGVRIHSDIGETDGYCSVDTGMLGCMPMDMIENARYLDLGIVYYFSYEFDVERTPEGTFTFGHVHVITGNCEDNADYL